MRIQHSYGRHVCQPTSKMSLTSWQCFITATDFYLTVPVTQDKGLMGDPLETMVVGEESVFVDRLASDYWKLLPVDR